MKGGDFKMYTIKNYMEDVVRRSVDNIVKSMDICKCEKCMADIIAISLNNLPPKYIVTEIGELYTKVNELKQQFAIDVQTAITKAAMIVGKNPKH